MASIVRFLWLLAQVCPSYNRSTDFLLQLVLELNSVNLMLSLRNINLRLNFVRSARSRVDLRLDLCHELTTEATPCDSFCLALHSADRLSDNLGLHLPCDLRLRIRRELVALIGREW